MRAYGIGTAAILIALCAPADASPRPFRSEQCGVSFSLPQKWGAKVEEPELAENEGVVCHIALRPKGWSELAVKSRWGVEDPPLWLTIYSAATSFESALALAGFEARENGAFEISGGYGTTATAEPYSSGNWSGLRADTFYRGFIRDEALLESGESNAFGGEFGHVLLRGPGARVVLFECLGGTPDEPVDCELAIETVTKTLELVASGGSRTPPD